jgi:hypothetical protein
MKKENEKQSDVDMKKAQHSEQTANTTTLFSQSGIPPPTQVNNVNRWSTD